MVENEEELNNTAIAEIMGEIQKKSVNEQVAGVGAWKKRAKIDNMFVARTLKVIVNCLTTKLIDFRIKF